jgi:hypothetical protein
VTPLKADNWQDVPGWLTPAEGGKLAELAAGKDVVELGAWCGRSTCAMSPSARTILSVDGFTGDADTGPADTLTAFLAYTNSLANVSHYVGRFEDGLPAIADGCADLVFIDGQHDANSVERDSRIAQRLLRPGGTVAYHDYTYESVREGSARVGFRSEGVADSLAWGGFRVGEVKKYNVCVSQPRYGPIVHPTAARAFYLTPSHGTRVNNIIRIDVGQSIAYAFNIILAHALGWRDEGKITHLAMIHADVQAEDGWLDMLIDILDDHKADVVSAVIPIKDAVMNPRTSTAIGNIDEPWYPTRYICVNDQLTMPETFGPEDVCKEGEELLINTGLWVADLRKPWWDEMRWTLDSRIITIKDPDAMASESGKDVRKVQMRSEDWEWSRFMRQHGARYLATWKPKVTHHGEFGWQNRPTINIEEGEVNGS